MENGFHTSDRLGPQGLIDRTQYIRLIQQALLKLGYRDVSQRLEKTSGIQMQPSEATEFQQRVAQGDWSAALQLLPRLTNNEQVRVSAMFLILQQKYLEALEKQDFNSALHCLRVEMAPLHVNEQQLHHLASLLLCPSSADPQTRAAWLQGGVACRPQLMAQLQSKLPPTLIIPDGRLEQLVEQALVAQVSKCQYHNASEMQLSLFSDYTAGIESLPTISFQLLEQHTDEVWQVAWSPCGSMLASASKDCTAVVWKLAPTGELQVAHVLSGHNGAVSYLAWSPDSSRLLTCCECTVRMWDVASGTLVHTITAHMDAVQACAWMPDGQRWVSGGVDRMLLLVDAATGREVRRLKRRTMVQDLCVAPNGTCLVIASQDKQIQILRLSDEKQVTLKETSPVTSIAVDPTSTHLLASLHHHTVHLWNLGGLLDPHPSSSGDGTDPLDSPPTAHERQYVVNEGTQSRHVLRAAFGGSGSSFVVQSSEDCQVHVWHRDSEEHLLALEGHSGCVNSVSWNPRHPHLLASASDDHTVRVWISQAALNRQ